MPRLSFASLSGNRQAELCAAIVAVRYKWGGFITTTADKTESSSCEFYCCCRSVLCALLLMLPG